MIKTTATYNEKVKALLASMKDGDETQVQDALKGWMEEIQNNIRADFEQYQETHDQSILDRRGIHALTSEETQFYNALIESVRDKKVLNATNAGPALPVTVVERVLESVKKDHPLINAINPTVVGAITKIIKRKGKLAKAVWGEITDEIKTEIKGDLAVADLAAAKLTAFLLLSQDYIELGPTWLDAYVRQCLEEALALGIEDGVINGTGVKQPVGLIRDIHEGVSFSTTTGYPEKTPVVVKSFDPKTYGELIAKMSKTESGESRVITKVILVVNPTDYFQKVMPSTTVLTASGAYVSDVFPFATEVFQSAAVAEGKAVLFVEKSYIFELATRNKDGEILTSDEYKFLEDFRTYKIRLLGTGIAEDNTCALLLDISGLAPLYLTVKQLPAA